MKLQVAQNFKYCILMISMLSFSYSKNVHQCNAASLFEYLILNICSLHMSVNVKIELEMET